MQKVIERTALEDLARDQLTSMAPVLRLRAGASAGELRISPTALIKRFAAPSRRRKLQ
jgi:hypothetical protein